MRKDPIDFDSPLGISKREWTRLLGANLALLLIVYAIAVVCTATGNDFFLLNAVNEGLENMEKSLRNINVYPIVQMAFATIEETIILMYVMKSKPKWWWVVGYFIGYVIFDLIFMVTTKYCPSWFGVVYGMLFCVGIMIFRCAKNKEKPWKFIIRFIIASAVSFGINAMIAFFRTRLVNIGVIFDNAQFFYLSVEYDIALGMALGFLTLVIPWEKGEPQCLTSPAAGGSSPTSKRCSRKNSLKKNNLTPKQRKRIFWLKAKVIIIQSVALAFIVFVPILSGKGTEFALLYVSFCITRLILGFNHSLHFKSELMCVTIGGLCFWGLTYLSPSAEVSIIVSLVYGCAMALGFRLYWELYDLMMYRKAAKTDRYAMFYTAFKGNLDPRHIRGIMIMRGYQDPNDVKMVQMYMAKEKVDYIAEWMNEPIRSVDRKLTKMAEDVYSKR